MSEETDSGMSGPLVEDFVSMLLFDVAASMRRYDKNQSEQARREMVRTLFAAIEGYTWMYREHIIEAARSMEELTIEEELALSEVSYQVTEQGKVIGQPRYMSMLATFRLTTRIASRLNPELAVRFDTGDWECLRRAVAIRNRTVHPKSRADLRITPKDLVVVQDAFHWLLNTAMGAMEAANAALRQFNDDFHAILTELRNGNPTVWAAYRAAGPE